MRILMLSHGYLGTISGVAQVVQKLARALAARDHQVLVLSGGKTNNQEYSGLDQGVMVCFSHNLPNPFWKDGPIPFLSFHDLRRVIADFQPDLIHTHENFLMSWDLLLLRNEINYPIVSSCYFFPGFWSFYLPAGQRFSTWIERFGWSYIIPELNRFDHVIFSTTTQAEIFQAHGLKAPFTVISNGVDITGYHPRQERKFFQRGQPGLDDSIEKKYALPPHPRLLFNGRLAKDKRVDQLILATAYLQSVAGAHLLLAGRGDEQSRLEQVSYQTGVEKSVHFLGFVPEADLPAIYRLSDLFVISATCEVQSIPCLKAVASGLPIVAVDSGALPELVHHGENGYLVPPGDPQAFAQAVLRALNDPVKLTRFRQASLGISQAHHENNTFEQYEKLYQSLIQVKMA